MRALALLSAVLLALGLPAAADAQGAGAASVRVLGSSDSAFTVGDPITIWIEVRHAAAAQVEVESAMTDLGALDAALPEIEIVEPGLTRVRWRTAAFTVGVFEVPLPPLVVTGDNGGRETLSFAPLRLEIRSLLADGAVAPRPLAPPESIGGSSGIAFIIAALLAVGAGFVLARVLGLRARQRGSPAVSAMESPAGPLLPDPSDGRSAAEYCRALARAVRAHLAARYSIPAQSLTSAELPEHLAAAGAPPATVQRIRTLLRECDAAAFAEQTPPPERLAGYLQLAAAIINAETPPA